MYIKCNVNLLNWVNVKCKCIRCIFLYVCKLFYKKKMDYNFENSDFKKIIILKNFVFVILYVVL